MPRKSIFTNELAKEFVEGKENRENLIYHTGFHSFFIWKGGWYKRLTKEEIETRVLEFLVAKFPDKNVTSHLVKDVLWLAKRLWRRKVSEQHQHYIALKDCLFNTLTFKTEEFDKKKITFHYLPYTYQEILTTPTPVFDKFLDTSLVEKNTLKPDKELHLLAQEMFGYFLLGDMKGATAWFLVGEGSNGKSVMCKTIEYMIGTEFTSAMSIQSLTTDKFKAAHLIGKRINISNEEESKYMRTDKFKALITGELIDAEEKFGDSFEFCPTTKFLFASNLMPTFDNINYALLRRIKIIPFYHIFKPEERDIYLVDKLKQEIPGIVRWALEGAKRLVDNNYVYIQPPSSLKAIDELVEEVSSAVRFVRENYNVTTDSFTPLLDIYEFYKEWCVKNGKKPVNRFNFTRDILSHIKGLFKTRKLFDGKVLTCLNLIPKTMLDTLTQTEEQPEAVEEKVTQEISFK